VTRERIVIAPVADAAEERGEILRHAARRGFHRYLLSAPQEAEGLPAARVHRRTDDAIVPATPPEGPSISLVPVRSPEDIPTAVSVGRREGAVGVLWSAERVIPLENLLAEAHGHFPVWVVVDRLRDLPAMLGALEHGADVVVVEIRTAGELDAVESALDEVHGESIPWELIALRRVVPAGIGDRVIVDTTSMLRPAEGLLVGSSAAFLFHVASEAVGSRFTRPRPFRVNAGAAHSYTLLADGATRYLSELVAGDSVLVAEPNGPARAVRVGRIKIERRPMILAEVEREGRRYTVFLQEAETVRLTGETEAIATTHLAPPVRVFGAAFPPARHMGGVVEETIEER
jgi:3-dehydroquinate synthase II